MSLNIMYTLCFVVSYKIATIMKKLQEIMPNLSAIRPLQICREKSFNAFNLNKISKNVSAWRIVITSNTLERSSPVNGFKSVFARKGFNNILHASL